MTVASVKKVPVHPPVQLDTLEPHLGCILCQDVRTGRKPSMLRVQVALCSHSNLKCCFVQPVDDQHVENALAFHEPAAMVCEQLIPPQLLCITDQTCVKAPVNARNNGLIIQATLGIVYSACS